MPNHILEPFLGSSFNRVAKQASEISKQQGITVEFEFNGIICLVNQNTNLDWLDRDYHNAFIMKWETVGPNCEETYPPAVEAELDRRNKDEKENASQRHAELEEKNKKEREEFEAKTKGVEIELSNPDLFNSWKANNTDGYGDAIFEYAEGWAKLMQLEISNGKTLVECADPTSFQLGFIGITGFMYGAAISILYSCWKHGEALRNWHNKGYGHEGEGVVNPAVVSIAQ